MRSDRPRRGRLIALTAATGVMAGGLVIGSAGMASPGITKVMQFAGKSESVESAPQTANVELRVKPKVDIGALPRIVAVNPGAAVASDGRRPDGPDSPPRPPVRVIPESDPPTQGVEGTQPDSPANRTLPPPQIAPPARPAPPQKPDVLPPPSDSAPAVAAPDTPAESLRPDALPAHLAPDLPPSA